MSTATWQGPAQRGHTAVPGGYPLLRTLSLRREVTSSGRVPSLCFPP